MPHLKKCGILTPRAHPIVPFYPAIGLPFYRQAGVDIQFVPLLLRSLIVVNAATNGGSRSFSARLSAARASGVRDSSSLNIRSSIRTASS